MTAKKWKGCSVDGCSGQHEARGLCLKHYARLMRTGTTKIEGEKKWSGRREKPKAVATTPETHALLMRLKAHFEELSPLGAPVSIASVLRAAVIQLAEKEGVK